LYRQGNYPAARAAYSRALAAPALDDASRASYLNWLACVCLDQGDLGTASAHSSAALACFQAQPAVDFPQRIHAVHALVLYRCGEDADPALHEAAQVLSRILDEIPAKSDRRRYGRNLAVNRFIRAAQAGDWHTHHPLF
ncbi:MAG: hypothetical protein H7Z42_04675, partial [Roseiflexaceae bacterium]|nr:hypothetical protein [Roseiflexaceae bacterium]